MRPWHCRDSARCCIDRHHPARPTPPTGSWYPGQRCGAQQSFDTAGVVACVRGVGEHREFRNRAGSAGPGLRHSRRRDAGGGRQDNDRGEPDGPRVLKLGIQRQPFLRSHGATGRCGNGRREGTGPGRSVVVEDRVIRNVEMRPGDRKIILERRKRRVPVGKVVSKAMGPSATPGTAIAPRPRAALAWRLRYPVAVGRRTREPTLDAASCEPAGELLRRELRRRSRAARRDGSSELLEPSEEVRRERRQSRGLAARAAIPTAAREFASDVGPSKLHREVEATAGPTVPGAWYLAPYIAPSLGRATQSKADIHDSAYSPISETWAIGQVTILSRGSHESRRGRRSASFNGDPQAGQGGPPTAGVTLSACRQREVDS